MCIFSVKQFHSVSEEVKSNNKWLLNTYLKHILKPGVNISLSPVDLDTIFSYLATKCQAGTGP